MKFFGLTNNKRELFNVGGFTLVEVLVSMGIFLIAISLGVLAVTSMDGASKRTQIKDQSIQSAYFLIDSLSRSIVTGKSYQCLDAQGAVVASCDSAPVAGFGYIDQDGIPIKIMFRVASNAFYRSVNGATAVQLHDTYALKIQSAGFMAGGMAIDDGQQPFVTIRILTTYTYRGVDYTVPLQITLTQRELDKASVI